MIIKTIARVLRVDCIPSEPLMVTVEFTVDPTDTKGRIEFLDLERSLVEWVRRHGSRPFKMDLPE